MTKFKFKYLIPTGPVLLLTIVEFVLYNLSSDDTVVQDSEINKLWIFGWIFFLVFLYLSNIKLELHHVELKPNLILNTT